MALPAIEIAAQHPSPTAIAPTVSAERLHELALEAFRVGNCGRLTLCEALRVLEETRLHYDLGFPSVAAYAAHYFRIRRAESYEHVRVGRALSELLAWRDAFATGRLSWTALKAISRVATIATQLEWLTFLDKHGIDRLLAEAKDALRRGGHAPRASTFGLPNLDQRLVLRFSRSEMARVRNWIEQACKTVAERTGALEASVEQGILFLCEKDALACSGGAARGSHPLGDAAGAATGSHPLGDRAGAAPPIGGAAEDRVLEPGRRSAHPVQVVYQRCPDCRRSRMQTVDGFVEVPAEEAERHDGCAEALVIDGPTPPRLRRRILAREGGRCGNPLCHHRADHCHHIVFRSRGGKTDVANEVAVCSACHALIHAGLLRVTGRADGELRWQPGSTAGGSALDLRVERAVADRLPVLRLVAPPAVLGSPHVGASTAADSRCSSASAPFPHSSAIADCSPRLPSGASRRCARSDLAQATPDPHARAQEEDCEPCALSVDDLASGLVRLGIGATRSRRLIGIALEALPLGERAEANVLRRAPAAL